MLPPIMRQIAAYLLPETRERKAQNTRARELITPIVQQREQAERLLG